MFPQRAFRVTGRRDPSFPGLSGRQPPQPTLKPIAAHLIERPPEERGGVNPCKRPDPGYGSFTRWQYRTHYGRLLLPKHRPVDEAGRFDLIAQFRGADLARLEYVRASVPATFMAVAVGRNGSYLSLTAPDAFGWMVRGVEHAMRAESPTGKAKAQHVALTSWSSGYRGIQLILQHSEDQKRISAVVLLDGLHTTRTSEPGTQRLEEFARFARRAAAGEAFMFVSYSSVMTDDYASTTESARILVAALGGHPVRAEGTGPGGLQLKEVFSQGQFHARGYIGGGKLDHCAHLLLLPEVAETLDRHWHPE
jgi:hypothetical protein